MQENTFRLILEHKSLDEWKLLGKEGVEEHSEGRDGEDEESTLVALEEVVRIVENEKTL